MACRKRLCESSLARKKASASGIGSPTGHSPSFFGVQLGRSLGRPIGFVPFRPAWQGLPHLERQNHSLSEDNERDPSKSRPRIPTMNCAVKERRSKPLAFKRPLLFRSSENASTPTAYAGIRTSKPNSDIHEARAVIQLFLDAACVMHSVLPETVR